MQELNARLTPRSSFAAALERVDALYVAGGSTFALLNALRANGAREAIMDRVRDGLPYIDASTGSIVAGPTIEPASLMDAPDDAPELSNYEGLKLMPSMVIPHADGLLPPYPKEPIQRTLESYGADHDLIPLRDDEAVLVDAGGSRVIASTL